MRIPRFTFERFACVVLALLVGLMIFCLVMAVREEGGRDAGSRHQKRDNRNDPFGPRHWIDPLDKYKDPIGHEIRKQIWGDGPLD